jgi:histidine ammonia-lyase
MAVTLDTLSDVTLEVAWRVGFDNEGITLSDRARARIKDCREAFERLLASEGAGFVYGSTAAPGARAKARLSQEDQEKLARSQNLWAPKAFGGGNKWVPEHAVRLVIMARVVGYIEGHGRIRLDTAEWVASLLSRPIPKMPLDTATGPGEVMPLSWLYPQLSEIDLAAGEIMSLYNGSPCATGFVADAALTAARRFRLLERVMALAIEAAAAPLDAYDPALQDITADPHQRGVLRRLNEYLAGVPRSDRLSHQAPVSWRIIPTVLATAARAVRNAEETAEQSLQSIAHNPVYLPPNSDHPDGRAISPGGFHNHQASRAIDVLNAAGADICALSAKHTSRLLDGTPFGLPKLLVAEDSGVIGTEFLAWSQTSHAERARQAAMPAVLSIGLEDPGGGQSDVAAPVFLAYGRYLDVSDAVDAALATLGMVIVQAFRISGRLPPPKLNGIYMAIDDIVAPFQLDRIAELGESLRQLKISFSDAAIGQGKLAALI